MLSDWFLAYHVTTGKGKEAAVTTTTTAAEAETATPREPAVVPSETIYLQIMEFLLDAKATPVQYSSLICLADRADVLIIFDSPTRLVAETRLSEIWHPGLPSKICEN